MRGALFMVASLSLWMLPASSPAQLGLPGRLGVPDVLDGVESLPGRLPLPDIERLSPVRAARTLLDARTQRLADLVRRHLDDLEWDDRDYPAVRGMILATGLSDEQMVRLRYAGFNPVREDIDALGLGKFRMHTPGEQQDVRRVGIDFDIR